MNSAVALLKAHYSSLRLPLAIMTGDADAIVDPTDQSYRLHEAVAGSALTVLPGLGHMIHYAAKGRIVRAVDDIMGLANKSLRWE